MKTFKYSENIFPIILLGILSAAGYLFLYGDVTVALITFFVGLSIIDALRYEKIISQKNREIAELKIYNETTPRCDTRNMQTLFVDALKEEHALKSRTHNASYSTDL